MRRLRLGVGGSLYKMPGSTSYTVDLSKLPTGTFEVEKANAPAPHKSFDEWLESADE